MRKLDFVCGKTKSLCPNYLQFSLMKKTTMKASTSERACDYFFMINKISCEKLGLKQNQRCYNSPKRQSFLKTLGDRFGRPLSTTDLVLHRNLEDGKIPK